MDFEICTALRRVRSVNRDLEKNPTRQDLHEMACIETRAAYAVFEDVSCWSASVDVTAQRKMIDVFSGSVRLLRETDADKQILEAVDSRITLLKEFDLERIMPKSVS